MRIEMRMTGVTCASSNARSGEGITAPLAICRSEPIAATTVFGSAAGAASEDDGRGRSRPSPRSHTLAACCADAHAQARHAVLRGREELGLLYQSRPPLLRQGTRSDDNHLERSDLRQHGVLSVRLRDERPDQDLSGRAGGPEGHHAVVLPGRQDRRARRQRLGQVDADADHGRPRQRLHRRGLGRRRRQGRLPAAGAAARPDQDGAGERDARAWRRRGRCWSASTRSAPASPSRSTTTRWRSCWRSRASCRRRSTPPTPGSWSAPSRSPWTRCAARPATPCRHRSPAASAGGWRSAGCCSRSPTCCCWTSRPTISMPSRSPGSSASCKDYTGTVVAVTHDRYFLDNVAGWILELDRGRGIP